MHDVMVDLETFGTGNDAAIIAIGACIFDPHGDVYKGADLHYQVIDLEISQHPGDIDSGAVLWWLQQDEETRKALTSVDNTEPLGQALKDFSDWLIEHKVTRIWGNGASFDEVVLRSAFRRYNMKFPISFRGSRCVRMVRKLPGAPRLELKKEEGVKHHALDDAIHQAAHVQLIYKELGLCDDC